MTTETEPDDYLDSWDAQVPPSAAERALQQRLAEQQKRHDQDDTDLTDDFLAEFAQANLDPVERT
jgi:hypothetical protein